jgi:hypothetical protein
MAIAVTKLPNAPAMAATVIKCCVELVYEVAACSEEETQLSAAEQAELLEAAKPAVVGMLRAAAAVVHSLGPSQKLYDTLSDALWYDLPGSAWRPWGLELLSMLHPVLLPGWMQGKPRAELRGFDGQEEADGILDDAFRSLEGNTALWQSRPGELRTVLLRYVLENPWAPELAVLALQAVLHHWPGCLDQPAGALLLGLGWKACHIVLQSH